MGTLLPINYNHPEAVSNLLSQAAVALRESPWRRGCCVHVPGRGSLLATGDLHDNIEHLHRILSLADLDASPDHHVILHELIHGDKLINGMDFSHRMLIRTAELVVRYPHQVHPLLANHELSQLMRRPISKGGGNSLVQFNDALDYVFRDEADRVCEAIDEFLSAMPLALRSEHGVFCAHSLPNAVLMKQFDPDALARELTREDYEAPAGGAYLMVWGRTFTQPQIDELAARWSVHLFVLGHQHIENGAEFCFERALVLNSDHARGAVVRIDLSHPPDLQKIAEHIVHLASVRA